MIALAWDAHGRPLVVPIDGEFPDEDPADEGWDCVLIRAVASRPDQSLDPHLSEFDARYEATSYPAEWLWGPGTVARARQWYRDHRPQPDECEYLDRTFPRSAGRW